MAGKKLFRMGEICEESLGFAIARCEEDFGDGDEEDLGEG
jgi:hypothetical protein